MSQCLKVLERYTLLGWNISQLKNYIVLTLKIELDWVSAKSGKSQGIHLTPLKVREKSGNLVKSQGKVREFY